MSTKVKQNITKNSEVIKICIIPKNNIRLNKAEQDLNRASQVVWSFSYTMQVPRWYTDDVGS